MQGQLVRIDLEFVQRTQDEELSEKLNGKIARPFLFILSDRNPKISYKEALA